MCVGELHRCKFQQTRKTKYELVCTSALRFNPYLANCFPQNFSLLLLPQFVNKSSPSTNLLITPLLPYFGVNDLDNNARSSKLVHCISNMVPVKIVNLLKILLRFPKDVANFSKARIEIRRQTNGLTGNRRQEVRRHIT